MKTFKTLQNLIDYLKHRGILKPHCEIHNLIMIKNLPSSVPCEQVTGNVSLCSGHSPDSGHWWNVKAIFNGRCWQVWELSPESRDVALYAGVLDKLIY